MWTISVGCRSGVQTQLSSSPTLGSQACSQVSTGPWSHPRLTGRRTCFPAHVVTGGLQFPVGCWREGAGSCWLPAGPCHVSPHPTSPSNGSELGRWLLQRPGGLMDKLTYINHSRTHPFFNHLHHLLLLEDHPRSSPLKKGLHKPTDAGHSGQGDHLNVCPPHFQALSVICWDYFLCYFFLMIWVVYIWIFLLTPILFQQCLELIRLYVLRQVNLILCTKKY